MNSDSKIAIGLAISIFVIIIGLEALAIYYVQAEYGLFGVIALGVIYMLFQKPIIQLGFMPIIKMKPSWFRPDFVAKLPKVYKRCFFIQNIQK